MIFKDYYKILELKTNKVSSEEIKNAYGLAVKKNHPDLNVKDKLAEEKIKDINEAYKILSDVISKKKYDKIWTRNNNSRIRQKNKEENQKNNSTFGEVFNMFFGDIQTAKSQKEIKRGSIQKKGENIETSIEVELEDVFYGTQKKIRLKNNDGKEKTYTVSIPPRITQWRKN